MDLGPRRRLILAAAAVALLVRLAFGLFYWTGKPLTHDEREYMVLAESLVDGRGFTYPDTHDVGTGQEDPADDHAEDDAGTARPVDSRCGGRARCLDRQRVPERHLRNVRRHVRLG